MSIPGLQAAKKLAKKSTRKHQHVALVFKGGALLATGYNYNQTHAEVAALKKLWPSKRRGTTVVSLRFSKDGALKDATPCKNCWLFMVEAGVTKVYASNASGIITEALMYYEQALYLYRAVNKP